jgi:hypothetical protein
MAVKSWPKTQNAHPKVSILATPRLRGVMYMGESDSTVSRPPKPVCDWILGRGENDVKEKTPTLWITPKALINWNTQVYLRIAPEWKTCAEPVQAGGRFQSNRPKDLGLIGRARLT